MIPTINANTEFGRETIRKKAYGEIKEFIDEQNPDIFLLNTPCGTGKTRLAVKLFKDSNYRDTAIFYVALNHDHCKDEVMANVNRNVLYLKGIKKECKNPDYQTIKQNGFNLNIQRVLCQHCPDEIKDECRYYHNINEVKNNERIDKVVTVQHYINTDVIKEFFNKFNEDKKKILIIDEDFFGALKSSRRITQQSLLRMAQNITLMNPTQIGQYGKYNVTFINSLYALHHTLKSTRGILEQKDFTDKFFEKFKALSIGESNPLSKLKSLFTYDWMDYYENYTESLYNHMRTHGFENDYSNQLHHVVSNCLEYQGKDVLLPFYMIERRVTIHGEDHQVKYLVDLNNTTELPEIPILVMDATVQADIIQDVFNRDVFTSHLTQEISVTRDVIQFQQGNYSRRSLNNSTTFRNVLKNIKDLIQFEEKRTPQLKIGIISYNSFRLKIRRKLTELQVDTSKITFDYFGHIRGSNKFNDCTVLFILGTYIPNIKAFPRDLGGWYVGEPSLIKEVNQRGDEFYSDKRYKLHLQRVTEGESIQAIDRIRFLFNKNKIVYLFSKIELPIQTEQYPTVDNYIFRTAEKNNEEYVYLKDLVEQGTKQRYKLHNNLNRRVPFRNEKSSSKAVTRTYEKLLKDEYIENERGKLSVTPKGKELFEELKNRNS